ncbi:hypothetical protein AB1Y20_002419 [Prymnesium parvum]|uniref:Protein arginine N-methyltransferase domain-containing protein n=1 Tax=Prymnesium parvum TaxID=97485 RepID=A0AB34J8Y2_PRYPA
MQCAAAAVVLSTWRRKGMDGAPDLELVTPPSLPSSAPAPRRQTTPEEKMSVLFGGGHSDAVAHQKNVGVEGSRRRARASHIDALALGGSTAAEGVEPRLLPLVHGLCFQIANEHTARMMCDETWAAAVAAVARRAARAHADGAAARVCVLALGSSLPALVAAREGAAVLWVERVERFAECARRLVARNGLGGKVQVHRSKTWGALTLEGQRFDTVITEELSDDLLEDGVLPLARHAATHLLPPLTDASTRRPRFVPARATVYCALLSLRVHQIAHFDLRQFNAFRSNDSVFVDVEHLAATDKYGRQRFQLLSAPHEVFLFDFERPDEIPTSGRTAHLHVAATARGIFNAVVYWYELALDGGGAHSFAPRLDSSARPFWRRARGQCVRFVGYERRLEVGERVHLVATHGEAELKISAPADAAAAAAASLVRWPQVNSLAYHWPMIADEGRNSCFDGALSAAVRRGGAGLHVLDIGSGSGLLAMMAARAGAARVTSLEMVPALAAAARHIVRQNGFSAQVTIIEDKSTDMDEAKLDGKADLLVCEIVDDQLLGEGVLTTVKDARRRLLKPGAQIIPSGAVVYALAIEFRPQPREGLHLDDTALFLYDQALCPRAHSGCKLQHFDPSTYKVLAPPLALFNFDWENAPVESLCDPRKAQHRMTITQDGTLNAFLIYFHLHCDERHTFSSGPDNPNLTAWDQNLRYLPIEVNVKSGTTLLVHAEHDQQMVRVGLPQLKPEWIQSSVGHHEILAPK